MTRVCEFCGKEFEQKPGVRPMRFCSLTCSRRFETAQRANDPEYKARRAARDRAYAATPEGRERLRAAVRKYQAKKRAERLAALQERLATSPIHCQRCGAPLDPQRPRRKVYCAECRMKLKVQTNRAKAREGQAWREETRACAVCGRAFRPQYAYQKTCSKACSEANDRESRRRAYMRHRKCPVCGTVFAPDGTRRKYCSAQCAYTAELAKQRARTTRTCIWCGRTFCARSKSQCYCSRACHDGAKCKRERDRYASKARGGGLTPAQIDRVQADVQLPPAERYAASKEWTPAMHTYARKLYEQHHGLFSACRPEGGFNGSQN